MELEDVRVWSGIAGESLKELTGIDQTILNLGYN